MKTVLRWWPLVIVLIMGCSVLAVPIGTPPSRTVNVHILAVNDFHGFCRKFQF